MSIHRSQGTTAISSDAAAPADESPLVAEAPPASERTRYVPQLDGIRAIAVLLVVLFHLNISLFRAGYVGVDIFFVVSGFLITTLVVEERQRSGRISLSAFWARRARRLLPALIVLLITVSLAAGLTGTASRRAGLRGDVLATTAYVANWRFIGTSSYFVNTGFESPLQHTWSLAIEEQFYLVWPLVAVLLLVVLGRSRRAIGVAAAVGAAVSVSLLAIRWSSTGVERAYMGTDARIFEPLIGALAAVLITEPWAVRFLSRHGRLMGIVGVLGIVAALILVGAHPKAYFDGGALLLSFMTTLVLFAMWRPHDGLVTSSLAWRPLVWIGVISYGIYLWHWPITLWLGARDPTANNLAVRRVAAVVLTIAVAGLSYVAVERPIRRGRWRLGAHTGVRAWSPRSVLIAVPVSLFAVACVGVVATRVPPVSSAPVVVMVTGDSVPKGLIPALEESHRSWRFLDAAFGGCPVSGEQPVDPAGNSWTWGRDCRGEVVSTQDRYLADADPDVVLWWDRASVSNFETTDGEIVLAGTPRYWHLRKLALDRTVRRLAAGGATVVLVSTEPVNANITPSPWGEFLVQRYGDVTSPWDAMLQSYAKRHPDLAVFLDIRPIVCHEVVSPCDDSINGVSARPHGVHYEGPGQDLAMQMLLPELDTVAAGSSQDSATEAGA